MEAKKISAILYFIALCSGVFSQNNTTDSLWNNSPIDLDQVVVTATRTPKKLKDTPVITQVITAQQIEQRGLSNIQDLLQQEVPGLNFQEVGYGTDIDIQGLGAKHILFLIDGERMAGENSGNIDYQRINLYNIDHIEIVKGASSALYGSQAMGGVINIITKQAKNKIEVNAGVRYAEKNQDNSDVIGVSKKHKEDIDKPNIDANASVGIKCGKIVSNTNFAMKQRDAYRLYDSEGYIKYFPAYDYTEVVEKSQSPTDIAGYQDFSVSEKLKFDISNNIDIRIHGGYYELARYDFTADNIYELNRDWNVGGQITISIDDAQIITANFHSDNYKRYDQYETHNQRDLIYENKIYQPKLNYINTKINHLTLQEGIEHFAEALYGDRFNYKSDYYDNSVSDYNEKTQWYSTAYIQADWQITNMMSVIACARADYHKEYGFNATPKLSWMWKIIPFTLRANYAMGYRSPTLKELYMNWNHLNMFKIVGNASLQPEHNNYVSLSGEYTHKIFNISCNIYGNWFRDKIEGIWANNQTEYHYQNLSHSYLLGLETMARLKIWSKFTLNANYNYLYTSKNDGVRLSSTSPHSGTVRLEFNSHIKDYETVVNINSNFMGKKDYNVQDEITIDNQTITAYYEAHVDAYTMIDMSIAQYIWKHFRITAGVQNLTNFRAKQVSFNSSTSAGRKYFVALNVNF